jgi:GH25 family lysozyme M1 (1,4-beta-N-acetylmuramidase)
MAIYGLGSMGDEVKNIQERLQQLNFFSGSVDGEFGADTEAAVKAFQKASGLDVDGQVGPITRSALFEINAVVDLSHHNGDVDLNKAKAASILGVIQKASQGIGYADPTYEANRSKAIAAGLYWGAYHFGTGSDGVQQAEHFLDIVKPGSKDLLVLDFEANAQGPSMTLEEARAFVTHVNKMTGRWPGLYAGHYLKELLGNSKDPVLSSCWFWLSQYGPTPVIPNSWDKWTMWQYTDGGIGSEPHSVDGIGRCDRDKFNGDEAALRELWGI